MLHIPYFVYLGITALKAADTLNVTVNKNSTHAPYANVTFKRLYLYKPITGIAGLYGGITA